VSCANRRHGRGDRGGARPHFRHLFTLARWNGRLGVIGRIERVVRDHELFDRRTRPV
jgi:hypothetical protein